MNTNKTDKKYYIDGIEVWWNSEDKPRSWINKLDLTEERFRDLIGVLIKLEDLAKGYSIRIPLRWIDQKNENFAAISSNYEGFIKDIDFNYNLQ